MIAVHQVLVGASPGDAISQMAIRIRDELRLSGPSEIFARFIDAGLDDDISQVDLLPAGRPRDILIYHSSFGDPELTRVLLRRPERLVIVYHNITPSRYFVDVEPEFAAGLEWGLHELELLRDRASLVVADSRFNADQLDELGFEDVRVIPAGADPGRLLSVTPSRDTLQQLDQRVPPPFVLGVSQLLPHKRHEVLIQAIHVLQTVHRLEVGLVLVGASRMRTYQASLQELVRRLRVRNVWISGRQSDEALAAIYRRAAVFVNPSLHEGLGLPPLEAMAFGVPVIVRDAGASAETVGDGALVLPHEAGPLLFAEAIAAVIQQPALRSALVMAGAERLEEFSPDAGTTALVELLLDDGRAA
jgi:glycosyltransferase involved in cell wall biosynthesis